MDNKFNLMPFQYQKSMNLAILMLRIALEIKYLNSLNILILELKTREIKNGCNWT